MSELKKCPFKGKFIIEVETSFETQETSDSVAYMLQEDFNERLKKALKEAEDRIFEWNDLSDEV